MITVAFFLFLGLSQKPQMVGNDEAKNVVSKLFFVCEEGKEELIFVRGKLFNDLLLNISMKDTKTLHFHP
jgi:hypothetical protein